MAAKLVQAAISWEVTTHQYAPVMHARRALARLTLDRDDRVAESARILEWGEGDPDRSETLRNLVPGLSDGHIYYLVANARTSEDYIVDLRNTNLREFHAAMSALVREARTMLKSEDDVAPTVPEQRRWWQRVFA
ncbi:hypothetical protein ACH4A8_41125 [Streptomyces vietnamensis]|uniref:hypothetical protein n=1 Tax=Streptomyces vietnamensis TaxID=362257 RepID=UPI0037A76A9E